MDDPLKAGIIFFNEGRFFEAHEVWEDLWRNSGGPLRLFYQGLVQAAVGMHHLFRGNVEGAGSVLCRAIEKLSQYPPSFCGIDNGRLLADLQNALQKLTPQAIRILPLE